jgi:hypothetical protein
MVKKKDKVGDFPFGFNVKPRPQTVRPTAKKKGRKWSAARARQFRASFGS